MNFKEILLKNLKKKEEAFQADRTDTDLEEIYFKRFLKELQIKNENFVEPLDLENPTYKVIPQFYTKLPRNHDSLAQKLREEARAHFLQKKSKELLNNADLKALWKLLEKHHTLPAIGEEQFITYDDYLKVKELAGDKFEIYLTATVFGKLLTISRYPGRISILSLFNYTMRKVWLQLTRIGLSLYDYTGHGYLRETDLESYIMELIPQLSHLEGLERSFHSFYVCTAVRKFFFFLDPLKTGRIKIRNMLTCNFLDDLLELKDENLPKDSQEQNWFSAQSALSVYGHYLNLDKDHNGMLSKTELAGYGSGTLTSIFLEHVFSECLTYDGEMDYKTYLDFVLALENRHEPQSMHYLFRILDFEHKGYLTAFTLNYFFKGIQDQIATHCTEVVYFKDIKDEIFDMVKPEDPTRISLKDLLRCGQGDTVISILIEFHKFWAYENREVMIAESPGNDEYYLGVERDRNERIVVGVSGVTEHQTNSSPPPPNPKETGVLSAILSQTLNK